MEQSQFIRRLRITASVFFTVLTVALCVQWVRSYWREDSVFKFYAKGFSGGSTFRGEI